MRNRYKPIFNDPPTVGGFRNIPVSVPLIVFGICSALSLWAAVFLMLHFTVITAYIALCVSRLLTSGILILAAVIAVVYCIVRIRIRMARWFWRL